MDLNHKEHFSNSSPSLHNNKPAQILRVSTNPKDPRSYPTPSTSSFHTQTTYSPPTDHSFYSSSEDIHETQLDNQNGWQQIRRTKRKRLLNSCPPTQLPQTETRNRYEMFTEDSSHPEASGKPHPPQSSKPPPIFLHGVINYTEMIKSLTEVAEEQFLTKSLTNNVIKLACSAPDIYRAIIKHCNEQNIYYHTYQLKEDRAFRVVIKHLHDTTNLDDIKNELRILGHEVRNIINVTHRQTKEPLNIFFVDLEPAKNNKDIYEVKAIQNKSIHIEPPRSTKPHIPQCVRCQQYGHTRKYCNKPFNCVKCGGHHNSATCAKPRDSPAKCALCGGPHPANYKGCEQYHNILKGYNAHRIASINRPLQPSQEQFPPPLSYNPPQSQQQQQRRSYAEVVNNNTTSTPADEQTIIFKTFLDEFRGLFTQLIQQNGIILNLLTALINNHR